MALPRIEIEPIVQPAADEITYDSGYIIGMGLGTHAIDRQEMFVDLRPYAAATGQLYPDSSKDERLSLPNIWVEAARSGLFAQVLGVIVTAANLLLKEKRLLAQIAAIQATADPEADPPVVPDTTELDAALAAVRAELLIQE